MSNLQYTLLLLSLGALWLVAIAIWLYRQLRRKVLRDLPQHAVVLVHGIMGFDKIGYGPIAVNYFRGAARVMRNAGAKVYAPRLPALASVPARAEALASFIRGLPDAKVNIVAHSMGGLDARWAISRLDLAHRVACLVTVATPHRGSPLADVASGRAVGLLRRVAARFGAHTHAIDWLTTEAAARINAEAPNHPSVVYGSIVARAGKRLWLENPILFAPWLLMRGDNDGLVPAESQRWGTVWMEVEHDHWGQVGWSVWRESRSLYVQILKELALRGG